MALASDDVGSAGPIVGGPTRRRPWARAVLGVVLLTVVAVMGTTYGRYLLRSRPGPRSMASALKSFRAVPAITSPVSLGLPAPDPGVYELHGQGAEHISFPPNSQGDGAIMPASVVGLAHGCWRWHVDYNVAHWEEYDFCPSGTGLVQVANRNWQAWDFGTVKVKNSAAFSCQPPLLILRAVPVVGQVVDQTCTGTNTAVSGLTTASGPVTVIGVQSLSVGGIAVTTVHELEQTELRGSQKGKAIEDWWFDVRTGLPVRMERHIHLATPSPLGAINYDESGWWQLASMTPTS
jgi:hypothetical protein